MADPWLLVAASPAAAVLALGVLAVRNRVILGTWRGYAPFLKRKADHPNG